MAAWFPLFINLADEYCVIIGGGPVAARKARTLLGFGAKLIVIAPEFSETMEALSPEHNITLLRRPYAGPEDLEDAETGTKAVLAVAATDDRECNRRVSEDAKGAGIPVNVADDPELCTFYFPALVKRGDLVGAISTSGDCPRLATRLREELERQWPGDIGAFLENLGTERKRLREAHGPADVIAELDRLITAYLDHGALP
ncbi:siroheme synthase [Spirochaetia bacterium]|nr:siroheme synthase [Spirochaetia bacterium]